MVTKEVFAYRLSRALSFSLKSHIIYQWLYCKAWYSLDTCGAAYGAAFLALAHGVVNGIACACAGDISRRVLRSLLCGVSLFICQGAIMRGARGVACAARGGRDLI